jgi:hypothetical protein
MKNLNLNAYGVKEMSQQEKSQVDGGIIFKLVVVEIDTSKPKGEKVTWFWEKM